MPRLLLIDDNLTDSAQLMQMLAAGGFLVEHVATLAEGLARTRKRPFDALLLDLDLPDSQGIATYLAAREQLATMAIVVLTDPTDDLVVSTAYQRGAQDFLNKSELTPAWLVHAVKHAILRAEGLGINEAADSATEPPPELGSIWSQERINEIVVLRLLPKRLLDANAIVAIETRLTSLVEEGNHKLVVSLENVDYMSNAALGVLIGAQKKIDSRNGRMHLADLKKNVRNQLGSRQFHRLFQIYDDVASAIASLAPVT